MPELSKSSNGFEPPSEDGGLQQLAAKVARPARSGVSASARAQALRLPALCKLRGAREQPRLDPRTRQAASDSPPQIPRLG